MTDLSPQAQAVLDAFWNGLNCGDDWGNANLAAALRAAVESCAEKRSVNPDSLLTELVIDADDLLNIATELENHG